ncbi:bifunctional phosphopantothenoylcysteine decarboxylase/phosphopantothenate--cysteine ligase CoaBC [Phycicoccus sp. CSK15P-2]|uniref:bifunctional phosphopantothenoylcysteine decarboxylase/phosphopantothenate--cysteine ligase CoaBC n=1 Tax=Phycicoccus sp. CSK15P-2 TaxID=2807627 RepID=UPI001951A47B|nr:bifunctional phosphopantothenoylcysteine decarboxylase/phosphopantothenate--cysteine ligase CoaBC [Phycicoccus sp. CSK15P-2]MBM6403751.1 bifunctional phosphopantothenoylcysteine decarboxylase/phosphopantothenate--cysteine ligase CoaBC [Phycicoccus sp. CSK15P-2]
MKVVLGVAGGIAAYKACTLLRLLTEAGHDVTVVPTASALRFVGEATWAALSGRPVHTDVWSDITEVPHVRIGQEADLVVVAPATADLLARAATGQADDLLTTVLLTARCPVVMAPAMHTEMYEHPATQANISTLTERGVHVVPPASGRLTGKDSGPGRLPEPQELFEVCRRELERGAAPAHTDRPAAARPLAGRRVVVTAGGTREPLDPVRYLGNRSSGKQGHALAAVAAARGAQVVLVTTVELAASAGVEVVSVETALEMEHAVLQAAQDADVVVMAAAVADFRPAEVAAHKIKKTHGSGTDGAPDTSAPDVSLVRNPDILAGLVAARGEDSAPVVVGFAAETGDDSGTVLDHGRAKLARKGCDVLVVNEVGSGRAFGTDDNTVHVLRQGSEDTLEVGPATKTEVSEAVWDVVADLL